MKLQFFLMLLFISIFFNFARAFTPTMGNKKNCQSENEIKAFCGVGDNDGCPYRSVHDSYNGESCWGCAAPGTPGLIGDSNNQGCPSLEERELKDHTCGDLKSDKVKYQKCITKNYPNQKNNGMSGGLGKPVQAMGMYGGDGPKPATGVGFCTPNHNESECVTPDGRVYKLNNSINQLERRMVKDREADSTSGNSSRATAIPK